MILRSRVLPAGFGWTGLAIGAVLQAFGVAGTLVALQPVVDTLLIVQGLWFLAASVAVGLQALRPFYKPASIQSEAALA